MLAAMPSRLPLEAHGLQLVVARILGHGSRGVVELLGLAFGEVEHVGADAASWIRPPAHDEEVAPVGLRR
jgi:hypothetical protein